MGSVRGVKKKDCKKFKFQNIKRKTQTWYVGSKYSTDFCLLL